MGFALGVQRAQLHAWPDRTVAPAQAARFAQLVDRRRAGEPVAYITGRQEFWSMELAVTSETLVPRPETEILVEAALGLIPTGARWQVIDLGTGCGPVALALARERSTCQVLATDISQGALQVARGNAMKQDIANVTFLCGRWLRPLQGRRAHLIVSNPPYVAADDPHVSSDGVRFEPRLALAAGADGLDAIREIVREAATHLAIGGWLALEHGFDQGASVHDLLLTHGYRQVRICQDLAGHGRVSLGRRPC